MILNWLAAHFLNQRPAPRPIIVMQRPDINDLAIRPHAPDMRLFDAWVRHLGPNPTRGQDCAEGFWWEDVCWHARVTRAQRLLDEHLNDAAEREGFDSMDRPRLRVVEDTHGIYRAVEEAR